MTNIYKIAITGKFRVGKDTVADIIAAAHSPDNVVRIGFADALKSELSDMVANYTQPVDLFIREGGYTYTKPGAYRHHAATMLSRRDVNGVGWQWWGEYRRRFYGEDYWITHPLFQSRYKNALADHKHIIITDMRHLNEARWCRREGFYLIRVEGESRSDDVRATSHPSEVHVRELPVHASIYNNGTLHELGDRVRRLLQNDIADFLAREP